MSAIIWNGVDTTQVTPLPWPEDLAVPLDKGDPRLRLMGKPLRAAARVMAEANYQLAVYAVNLLHERGEIPSFADEEMDA